MYHDRTRCYQNKKDLFLTDFKSKNEFKKRLVNLTESIWPKSGLNMTKTDKPYLLEHDQKMTTTNINLLSLTESDWIWPNEKKIIFPQRQKYTIEFDQKKKKY